MKLRLATTLVLAATLVLSTFSALSTNTPAKAGPDDPDTPGTPWPVDAVQWRPSINDNVTLKWNEELLQTIRANPAGTGPTITSRALGVLHTAMFDAWAAYDAVAKGTRLGSQLRRPASERNEANKSKAISYAAYKTLVWLFPSRQSDYAAQMSELNYPLSNSTDKTKPEGVGNRAAQAVIDFRSNDGSNQLGNPAYGDTTGYQPVNTVDDIIDPWRWQPLCVLTADGVAAGAPAVPPRGGCVPPNYSVQRAYTPQWKNVTPFSPFTYEIPGPRKLPNGEFDPADVDNLLAESADLTDREKVTAEYWADGPQTEFPPGHAAVFAQVLCRKRGQNLDADTKMFFALGNAVMDAGIASWWAKYQPQWDFVRPATAIRARYAGQTVTSWLGPYNGYGPVDGSQWRPYQDPKVVTPPFPEYVSGHSTFSAAAYWILNAFTGSDTFGASVTIKAGSSLFEPRTATKTGTPATDVTLSWPTFSHAAQEAGLSRIYGGIHFRSGNEHGRMLGQQVGQFVYSKAQSYIRGRVPG
jgi:PAP2 superfamily